ncbi:winged helix-turn-helix domain-containing protein [Streptomyces albicerus]|uniref:winged helix-turn-helix domain-containing protein n=1 Tax=Streptomyces albicerus TaxID=2569859 RepID=UPI00124B7842|nr:winged helix-turn-helix domain-containing protein [Streptomyces albicerus]
MLRVYFTSDDLARVRVAAAPDPLWEITNSFQSLAAGPRGIPGFAAWRRQVRLGLPPACAPLAVLLPPRGYSPDFLTPDLRGVFDLESALDTVLSTSRDRLRTDMSKLAAERPGPFPAGARALAEGESGALRRLGTALRAYHRHALVPVWAHIRAHVDADLALRARAMMEGGTERLLSGFRPVLRWQPPVLEADYPVEREVRLEGRGLLLQPSFFCVRTPVTLADSNLTPSLVYPLQHTLGGPALAGSAEPLGALIGRTRAAILEAVVIGRTTSELAGRFGISRPAASQHTAVLREAGLLLSVRRSKSVLHTITPAGLALLASAPGTAAPAGPFVATLKPQLHRVAAPHRC